MSEVPLNRDEEIPRHGLYSFTARSVSLLMAVALSVLVFAYPKAFAGSATEINHGVLSLWMWGIAAGFVHGVGFVPRLRLWKFLFGPWIAWGLMVAGSIYLFWLH